MSTPASAARPSPPPHNISTRSFSSHRRPTTPDSSRGLLEDAAAGAADRSRATFLLKAQKVASFVSAIASALCAGSITAYSLYGPLFISHLEYTQYRVNAISTVAELALYLPVPIVGWVCDRWSPRPLSAASAVFFGTGYALAAGVYRSNDIMQKEVEMGHGAHKSGWPFGVMILAFALVGIGTVCMYMSAVTTCAKNFGRGRHKGLALGAPIACFGLSGMWQSQVASHFFKEGKTGDIDVFHFFIFLAALLFAVGSIGAFGLNVVDEEGLIEDAVEDMERSGLLPPSDPAHAAQPNGEANNDHPSNATNGYGTLSPTTKPLPSRTHSHLSTLKPSTFRSLRTRILNHETRLFLSDPTMWALTLGFFLTSGPGETYQNNVGTLLATAYTGANNAPHHPPGYNTPATHVSLIALTSTLARLLTGTLSDLFAPPSPSSSPSRPRFRFSRLHLLLPSTLLFSIALLLLSTPLPHSHPTLFPLCSSLVGLGYGAIFSLTPIITSVVWGVENFGTNWGIVAVVPAPGAAFWGGVYSLAWERGAGDDSKGVSGGGEGDHTGGSQCYGPHCYQGAFLGMAVASWVAIAAWVWAWRGWKRRGVAV